ncbi:MAG: right-handed parallel beta-helix repeat-containing protein [Chloroflexi bacterium]|nr:right-handed parallel beta-helix repeat-containing protein [Chloroflexota bacterium]
MMKLALNLTQMKRGVARQTARRFAGLALLLRCVCAGAAAVAPAGILQIASAAPSATPVVRYDALAKIIYIGDNYDSISPYAGYPNQPGAPKDAITIPDLAAILTGMGHGDLLEDQGSGIWLLKSDTVISPTARLEATNTTITELRLDATPNRFPALTRLIAHGGHLLIQGIKVNSWNAMANTVDTNYLDQRSYLLAREGGRMDIIQSEVSYLGYADGEPSGLAWRKRATELNPATGAMGSIQYSNIHHNYFGQYSYEAYGLDVQHNDFHDNVVYGFDPHDYSTAFVVAYNKIYNNGKHGIIFSRLCTANWIHHNEVYGNAEHGIMLDRGSNGNKISDNLVYNNRDGVAIFQSSDNLIQDNTLRNNERGVRINATYDQNDEFDGLSTGNTVLNNTILDNTQYGIYFYERADKNTIAYNLISGTLGSGIYVKTGGNTVMSNTLRANDHGLTILGGPLTTLTPGVTPPVPAADTPGHNNKVTGNIIENNRYTGIQIKTGDANTIGTKTPDSKPGDVNVIRNNWSYGISIDSASVDTLVTGNLIQGNGLYGVLVKGADTLGNTISQNSIFDNGKGGVRLSDGANEGIAAPVIGTLISSATTITGTAPARAEVEVYRDGGNQGRYYLGKVSADSSGRWSFTVPPGDDPAHGPFTALATSQDGSTSEFGNNGVVVVNPLIELGSDDAGALTIFVSNEGANVTLPVIREGVQALTTTQLVELQDPVNKVWQLNANLSIENHVTLTISSDTVNWLKLRSQSGDIVQGAMGAAAVITPNYNSFVYLRTYDGVIRIENTRITSWDPTLNTYDTEITDGRSYLLAKYDARMDIKQSEVSYLGSPDGESYGVSWRDINSSANPNELRTRVTGNVISSTFSYNYYGGYTFQASNMVFRGNQYHHNMGYGLDPHDFSHHFLIEYNAFYENGNHGLVLSRGCYSNTIRYNTSYNNRYTAGTDERNAHGFMLDPGSPNSQFPQVASYGNLIEHNQAWGNEGYGLRILTSNDNLVQYNDFSDNDLQGLTVEGGTGNRIHFNTVNGNGEDGVYLTESTSNNSVHGNSIMSNGRHGIYIKSSSSNWVTGNSVSNNGFSSDGSGVRMLLDTSGGTPVSPMSSNVISGNVVAGNAASGIDVRGGTNTTIQFNTVTDNHGHGVYLTSSGGVGATGNQVLNNAVRGNYGHGIRANDSTSINNRWAENTVFDNALGGIANTSQANMQIPKPKIQQTVGRTVTGTVNVTANTITPGSTVKIEIYSDSGKQGRYFEGSLNLLIPNVPLGTDVQFVFTKGSNFQAPNLNAVVTDAAGNSSPFTNSSTTLLPRLYLPQVVR